MSLARMALVAALAGTAPLPGQAALADPNGTPYSLITPPSSLEAGCLAPCECPIDSLPIYGSFELTPLGSDPQYTYYRVDRFIGSFNNGPGAVSIMGSGEYKTGGEFAAMQQMTLDLEVWGGPTEHFDSGLVPVHTFFPEIEIKCAVHGFHCYDSLLTVAAKPIESAGAPLPPRAAAGIQEVRPNPFAGGTSISFRDVTGPLELVVLDLEGRRVRTLAHGPSPGGSRSVIWDGRDDRGRVAGAGIYWVALTWRNGADRRRIVKLD